MHNKRRTGGRACAVAVALALILAACSVDTPNNNGGKRSGIVLAISSEPRTLASTESLSTIEGQIIRQIQEPLLDRDKETLELRGVLATRWELINDTTWRFWLRHGVRYHDGSPFDAKSAAFVINWNYNRKVAGEGELQSFRGSEFKAVEVNKYVIDIVLETPDPILPNRMTLATFGSMKQIKSNERAWEIAPVGTGPYKFVNWKRGQSIELELNKDWWGHKSPDAEGQATIDHATFIFRPDEQSRASGIQTGEVDVAPNMTGELCKNQLGENCFRTDGLQMAHIRIDHMNPVLGDRRIREAIALAIDKELLGQDLLPGVPASMMIPPGAAGFDPSLNPYPFDMDRAKQLVREAEADGVPVGDTQLTVVYQVGKFPQGEPAGQYIVAQLQEAGLKVRFQPMEPALLLKELVDPDPKPSASRGWLAFHSTVDRFGDYANSLESWILCDAPISTYCNPEVDRLYDIASPIPTGPARDEALREVARVVYSDFGNIPLDYLDVSQGVASRVKWDFRKDTWPYLKNMSIVEQ